MDFDGKVAFVTGATGMSQAAALELARRGANVAILSRTREEVEALVRQIESHGVEGLALTGDISKEDDVRAAVRRIDERWGGLDVVFANAGVNGKWAPIEELSLEDWNHTISINLTGTFLTVRESVAVMRRGGSIVITASVNGTRMFSNTGASAYATSKAGQVAFTQMMALELAPRKIRVNVICPGAIETEIDDNTEQQNLEEIKYPVSYPKGRVPLTEGKPGRPEQVAQLVCFLASDAASHITGTPVWIDGAESLLEG